MEQEDYEVDVFVVQQLFEAPNAWPPKLIWLIQNKNLKKTICIVSSDPWNTLPELPIPIFKEGPWRNGARRLWSDGRNRQEN